MVGIFALAALKGCESVKASLVDRCIECSKELVENNKAKIVYLGLEQEYQDIFYPMNFIRSREVDFYKFAPQQEKKEIVQKEK